MPLSPGSRLGAYEVLAPLGAGGMGEVYRARDTRLGRDVALKVLPAEFALDPERLARFTREAQVLASLNHPGIAAIYGIEDHALVLELVDGPTVADRIAQGRIDLEEALPIARQIAEALEAAHEQGIIHRDLKPANIKVRPDGTVKVLDFGLAKLIEGTEGPPQGGHSVPTGLTASPTITTPAMTMAGVILGTAAYMSPEQAKGRAADKRSDIWAFGCVLFEMLTRTRPFDGDDVSDTLAAVLRAEPDWSALPADTPPRIRTLVERCLHKDVKKRLPHIAMARFEIDEISTQPPGAMPAARAAERTPLVRRLVPLAIAMVLTSVITSAVWWALRPQPARPVVTRFAIPLAEGEQTETYPFQNIAISSDGTQIVYAANRRLNLRRLSQVSSSVVQGTDTGLNVGTPAFSPDGSSLAYVSTSFERGGGAAIHTITVGGGVPTTVARTRGAAVPGLSWGADGILYADLDAGVMLVPASAGKPQVIAPLGAGEAMQGPSMLPGTRVFVYAIAKGREVGTAPTLEMWDTAQIVAQSLAGGGRKTLIEGGSDPHYVNGHLLYTRAGAIFAVPFDVSRLAVTGTPVPVLDGVARSLVGARASTGYAQFAVSDTGTIVYAPGSPTPASERPKFVTIDRAGNVSEIKVRPGFYGRPRVSPDGTQVAVDTEDTSGDAIVWIYDLSGRTSMRQLTFEGRNRYPVWSPDGRYVAFQSDRDGDGAIYWKRSDGSAQEERLTTPEKGTTHSPESWSPDGKHLLFAVSQGSVNALRVYSFETKKTEPFGGVQSPRLISASFSPDGRWVAYTLTTNGQNQVFVQPFPSTGAKYLIGMGARPQWSPDGKEIFVYTNDASIVKTVTTKPSFSVSNETPLPFNVYAGRGPGSGRDADIMPDGKRWIAVIASTNRNAGTDAVRQFQVVLNWFEELNERSRAK